MSESGKESETDALNDFTLLCILNALSYLQLIYFAFCECDYDIKKYTLTKNAQTVRASENLLWIKKSVEF